MKGLTAVFQESGHLLPHTQDLRLLTHPGPRTQSDGVSRENSFVLFHTHNPPGPNGVSKLVLSPSCWEQIPYFESIENRADWVPSWGSLSHSCADFPFLVLRNLNQHTAECSSRLSCYYLKSQGWSSPLTLCSRGEKHKESFGKEHWATLTLEGQRSGLNTDLPSAHCTMGGASSWEEAQLR